MLAQARPDSNTHSYKVPGTGLEAHLQGTLMATLSFSFYYPFHPAEEDTEVPSGPVTCPYHSKLAA